MTLTSSMLTGLAASVPTLASWAWSRRRTASGSVHWRPCALAETRIAMTKMAANVFAPLEPPAFRGAAQEFFRYRVPQVALRTVSVDSRPDPRAPPIVASEETSQASRK